MTHTHPKSPLKCTIKEVNPHFCYATVIIPAACIDELFYEIARAQKNYIQTIGFNKSAIPIDYIKEHYKNNITEHIKEFAFKFFVINFLYDFLQQKKLLVFGEPRLHDIYVEANDDAQFEFEVSLSGPIDFREWKNFPFKAPKRKNYKDIDRQVETFIKQEQQLQKEHKSNKIEIGDWVCFNIGVHSCDHKPLFDNHHENNWLKIGSEEADTPFQKLFLSKKVGDHFYSQEKCLQEYFSNQLNTHYTFSITIEEIVHNAYFSFDDFKQHFRLKSNKDVHAKLIEIFSYRNDLSQRRSIVEEALKLLLSKHHIEAPNYLVLRQQKMVLKAVQDNPDYQVYKTQQNFKDIIRQLAIKQVKEMILIDQLAYNENIKVTNNDIKNYLNLLKRPRTKEFIYFSCPPTKMEGQEMPIPTALLSRSCLREKTLNTIIHHLTRK